MRRRALLTTLATSGTVALAGCSILDDDALDEGDTVELPDGRVTVGHLGFQSSFVDDTTAPATVHAEADTGYVVLECDCRDYDSSFTELPFGVDLNGESVVGDTPVSGGGDGTPRPAFPVPTGEPVDSGAVVVENAHRRERRHPFDQRLREQFATPPRWRVDVDWGHDTTTQTIESTIAESPSSRARKSRKTLTFPALGSPTLATLPIVSTRPISVDAENSRTIRHSISAYLL